MKNKLYNTMQNQEALTRNVRVCDSDEAKQSLVSVSRGTGKNIASLHIIKQLSVGLSEDEELILIPARGSKTRIYKIKKR